MNVMDEVAKLQQRLADAQRQRARAEGAYTTAKAIMEQARADLKRDFGVDSVGEAEELMDTMRQEIADLVAEISAELDRIGIA
jgi:uncharacterized protein involved in exopolysaccharide biosynthesis